MKHGAAWGVVVLAAATPAFAQEDVKPPQDASKLTISRDPYPAPWEGIGEDLVDAFSGWNLLFYEGAVGATALMAPTGADHALRVEFVRYLPSPAWGDVAFVSGYAVPVVTASTVWILGLATKSRELTGAGSAAIQAGLVTFFTTSALKLAIGRPYPLHGGDPRASDRLDHPEYAYEFRPFRNGFGAWPSGHTSGTISIAAALTAYAPDNPWIPLVGYPLGFAIGLGMMDRDSHWGSDVVAGALVGHAIGWTIGRNFRRRVRGDAKMTHFELVPLPGAQGVALRAEW